MKKIVLYGSGGHCNSIIDVIESKKNYQICKIFDDKIKKTKSKYSIEQSSGLKFEKIKNIHISFASIYDLKKREKIFLKLKKEKFIFPIIKSKNCYISKNVKISDGSIVMHGAIINYGSKIESNVIINSNSLIEHDVSVGFNSHISTSATINGGVKIGKNCFIGSRSVIKENIIISDNSFIKMGSIITKNI